MKFAKSAVLAAAALALAGGSAWAADIQTNKKAASNVSRSDDSGFAKLDKNKDGYISKAEAAGEPTLHKDFAKWDMNNDGKINRAEYLAAMAKEDAVNAKNKVSNAISSKDKDKSSTSSTGGSSTSKTTK